MSFLNDFKNAGGRVTTGSDSGFIYQTYGFGYILELEMLQEAGFHPLEVIRSATLYGAEALHEPKGRAIDFGILRAGLKADLVITRENPRQNFKTLYGTGAVRINDAANKPERVGGIDFVVKDGIVYNPKKLLADVAVKVEKSKTARRPTTTAQ
jgi:imidazolonepropionase-like amidohydrolase